MYDLEILVPADLSADYIRNRFIDFKSWGLLNIQDYKIKLVLATPPEDFPDLLEGWPKNVDVEILRTPFWHVAQRNTYYYSEYLKPNTARWYMRIDEDSINDISGLLNNLDRMYDHEGLYHLASELVYDLWPIDREILRSLGFGWWYSTGEMAHEWEISITSNAVVKKLYDCPSVKQYMQLRQDFAEGYGDHSLSYCTRMIKVYPIITTFIIRYPDIINFSLFGGVKNHIHEIARDRNWGMIDWINSYYNNTLNQKQDPSYFDRTCILSIDDEWKKIIKLSPNGFILHDEGKVGLWHTDKENKLNLLIQDRDHIRMKFDVKSTDFITSEHCDHCNIKLFPILEEKQTLK